MDSRVLRLHWVDETYLGTAWQRRLHATVFGGFHGTTVLPGTGGYSQATPSPSASRWSA
jgi:hypothetical protein